MEDAKKNQIVMIQFMQTTGLQEAESRRILDHCKWDFQAAISLFFQQAAIHPVCKTCNSIHPPGQYQMCVPSNTPATPPNLEALLSSMSRISTAAAPSPLSLSPPAGAHCI